MAVQRDIVAAEIGGSMASRERWRSPELALAASVRAQQRQVPLTGRRRSRAAAEAAGRRT